MRKIAQIFAMLLAFLAGTGCVDKNPDNKQLELEAPTVTIGEITTSSVTFSWKEVKNATGYEYKLTSGDNVAASDNVSSAETTAAVDGLAAETAYKISMRAIGNEDYLPSAWSEASFTTKKVEQEPEPEPTFVEIKDDILRKYLIDNGIDTDSDGNISFEEAAAFKTIEMGIEYEEDANDANTVKDISGLENFTSLEILNLKFHRVTDASPIEKISALTSLNLGENPITELDLTELGNITDLRLYGTQVENLELAAVPKLTVLYLQRTAVTSLDLSVMPELEQAFINQAQLTKLTASGLSKLTRLDAVENKLTDVNISDCQELMELHLNNNSLSGISLSGLPKLMRLNLYSNKLTSLDVTGLPFLLWLYVFDNNLESLDLSGNAALRELYTSYNPLKEIDLSIHESLEVLEAEYMPNLEFINLKNGYYSDWAYYAIAAENPSLKKVLVDPGFEFDHVSLLFSDRPDVIVSTGEETPENPFPEGKIYIAGGYSSNTAVIWIDGVQHDLPDGGIAATANDVYVAENGDVYAVGWDTPDTGIDRAVIWKNGEMTYLSDGRKNTQAKKVIVYGNDVYVAGNEIGVNNKVILWKNGVAEELPSEANYAEACSMVISDNGDIYVVGYDNGPVVWKNGEKTGGNFGDAGAQLLDIHLNGSDIYYSGFRTDSEGMYRAMVWKGTEATELTDGSKDCMANAVWVSDSGDVYASGNQSSSPKQAMFWKNGVYEGLTSDSYRAFEITGDGSDLYVVGQISTGAFPMGQQMAAVWKNGEVQILCDYNSEARAIFIR